MKPVKRTDDKLFWSVLGASGAVALLTLVAIKLNPPTPPPTMRGMGRSLPRMAGPRPGASTGDLLRSMGIGSLTWYVSILSAPLFVWLSRRMRFDRKGWAWALAVHVAVIAGLSALTGVVQYQLSFAGAPGAPSLPIFLRAVMLTGSLPFVTVATAVYAVEARLRARDREVDAARVRGQLAEARLEALNAQLQPHFLFNTLQAISTLISRDPAAAEKMLTSLADLLREVLRKGERREIELSEELRILESYLDISRRRFGDRLTVTISAPSDTQRALVPFFVLQPLVENALHHGVGSRAGPATIHIAATRDNGRLWLTVTDDGAGAESPEIQRGIGLTNTQARLAEMYGDDQTLELTPLEGRGFRARVGIAFHEAVPA